MAWASTETIGAGLDRSTIVAWEDVHDGETPSGGSCIGKITGSPDSQIIYFAGFTANMDATNKMVLMADTGNETDGTDGGGDDAIIARQLVTSESTYDLFLDIKVIEFNAQRVYLGHDNGGTIQFGNCFFRNHAVGDYGGHIMAAGDSINAATTINVGGCLFKGQTGTGGGRSAIYSYDADATFTIWNCTVYAATTYGLNEDAGAWDVVNTAVANTATADFQSISGTFTNNASEDATATGADSHTGITPANEWTNPATDATGDFSILVGGDLNGGGTAQPAWFTSLTGGVDMAGTAWAGTPSIGCFEYVGGEPPAAAPARRRRAYGFVLGNLLKTVSPLWFLGACATNQQLTKRELLKPWRWLK